MLTPKQADAVATALQMRPRGANSELLTCPACGKACIPQIERHRLSPFGLIHCPACAVPLRLKWARTICAISLLPLAVLIVWIAINWPTAHHFTAYLTAFIMLPFTVLTATIRRLALTADQASR
jgi:hypothetical protein